MQRPLSDASEMGNRPHRNPELAKADWSTGAPRKGKKMMRTVIASVIAALTFGFAIPATSFAQEERGGQQKVKSYDFSGDTIDGELIKPDGEMLDTRSFASHTSLIRIRTDFIKEILKSAEDL